jgi:hypothetical protein
MKVQISIDDYARLKALLVELQSGLAETQDRLETYGSDECDPHEYDDLCREIDEVEEAMRTRQAGPELMEALRLWASVATDWQAEQAYVDDQVHGGFDASGDDDIPF